MLRWTRWGSSMAFGTAALCLGQSGLGPGQAGLYPGQAILGAQEVVPFDSPRWEHVDSEVTEVAGRTALQGSAILADADFLDGVIEYDLYITGARSYPGVYVRFRDMAQGEHFYIRPHRAGLYPDAVQYAPVVNGISEWQLYNGPGYTNGGVFPEGEWIPVRLEIAGSQARYFVGDLEAPALEVHYLEAGGGAGAIALTGPKDGSAYFSDFRYRTDVAPAFDPAPEREIPEGMVREWLISQAYPADQVNRDAYPNFYGIVMSDWEKVEGGPSGLVDVARRTARVDQGGRSGPGSPDLLVRRGSGDATESGLLRRAGSLLQRTAALSRAESISAARPIVPGNRRPLRSGAGSGETGPERDLPHGERNLRGMGLHGSSRWGAGSETRGPRSDGAGLDDPRHFPHS